MFNLRRSLAVASTAIVDSALPQACLACARSGARLCAECAYAMPAIGPACPLCALPVPGGAVCGSCLRKPPDYDRTRALYHYAFPIDRLVQSLKYGGRLATARLFADAFAETFAHARDAIAEFDLIVPVPLARERLRSRGFNQAAEIARRLAVRLRVANDPLSIERTRDTATQTDLPIAERRRNVRGAFQARWSVAGARLLVIDDVMTTGATLGEIARTAKRAGARSVENWVVARAYARDPRH